MVDLNTGVGKGVKPAAASQRKGVKVGFKIGDHRGASANYAPGLKAFEEAFGEALRTKMQRNTFVNVPRLQKTLDYRIAKSLDSAIKFAAKSMIGAVSAPGGSNGRPTKVTFDWQADTDTKPAINGKKATIQSFHEAATLEWQALAYSTVRNKKKIWGDWQSARRHFIHTGALRKELLDLSKTVVAKTGTVQINYKSTDDVKKFSPFYRKGSNQNKGRRLTVGQLQLKYVPNLMVKYLPGLARKNISAFDPKMRFEASLGISESSIHKLGGGFGPNRPLLQPIFTYWILNRLPRVTASAINSSITRDLSR